MNKYYLTICLLLLMVSSLTAADLTIRTDAAMTFAVEIPGLVARTGYSSSHTLTRLPGERTVLYLYYAQRQAPIIFEAVPMMSGAVTTYILVSGEEGDELRYAGTAPSPSYRQPSYEPWPAETDSYEPVSQPLYETSDMFSDLMGTLQTRRTDRDRLALVQSVLPDLAPTTAQVREMLAEMSFEASRKTLALEAYDYVRDPERYITLVSDFDFATTVDELAVHCIRRGPLFSVDRGYTAPCDAASFAEMMDLIDQQPFDKTKLLLARWLFCSVAVSSRQVSALMELYSFDQSRLEVAKAAYPLVLDPERYFVVREAFDFESTGRQLDVFIKSSRRE